MSEPSKCVDNSRLGRIGCGQEYSGELQHSVAKVSWSEFPDGLAHVTAYLSTIDRCWSKGKGEMLNPKDLGFVQNDKGVWRSPNSGDHWTESKEENNPETPDS